MMEYGYDIRGRRVLMDMTGLHPDDVAMLKRPPENGDGDGDGEAGVVGEVTRLAEG